MDYSKIPSWLLSIAMALFAIGFLISLFLLDEPKNFMGLSFGPPVQENNIADLKHNSEVIGKQEKEPLFYGFSYYTNGQTLQANTREKIICSEKDFDTTDGAYEPEKGIFRVKKDGYYSFSASGFINSEGRNNERFGIILFVDSKFRAMSGGSLAAVDTPSPQFHHIVYLKRGQEVSIYGFSPIALAVGEKPSALNDLSDFTGKIDGHEWWFQGIYLGE